MLYSASLQFYDEFIACFLLPKTCVHLFRGRNKQKEDINPTTWDKYFADCSKVIVGANVFNIYSLGDKGPLLVLLHGGGYNGLTWALFAVSNTATVEVSFRSNYEF